MRTSRHTLLLWLTLTLPLGGCSSTNQETAPQVPTAPSPPQSTAPLSLLQQQLLATPLPTGWIWPFTPDTMQQALAGDTLLRPFDLSAIAPLQSAGPDAPVQVAPNVWVSMLDRALPLLKNSTAVPVRPPQRDAVPVGGLPAFVDLRAQGLDGPVRNQQLVGVCWTFGVSTVMENALRRAGRRDVIAPLHVLSNNVWDDIFIKGKSTQPLVTEPQWPYDPAKACKLKESGADECGAAYHVRQGSWREDPQIVGERQMASQRGVYVISQVEQLRTEPLDTQQLAVILASGQSVFLSVEINVNAWSRVKTSVIPDWNPPTSPHALVAVGYRQSGGRREFLVHNSWGTTWAENGYVWVSEAMLLRYTQEAFTLEVEGAGVSTTAGNWQQGGGAQTAQMGLPFPLPTLTAAAGAFPWLFPTAGPAQQSAGAMPSLPWPWVSTQSPSGTAAPLPWPFSLGLPAPAAQTQPATQPAQSSCPTGQLLDPVAGHCAPRCANGMPRTGGVCLAL